MSFKKSLVNFAKQILVNCLSIISNIGAYPHQFKYNELVHYELSLPTKYCVAMKGFCLYHQKDFNKFSDEQKQQLISHHGKTLKIETVNNILQNRNTSSYSSLVESTTIG